MGGAPNIFAVLAVLGWAPLVVLLFVLLPARRVVVVGAVAAWLLLPPMGLDFRGIPPYTKATAATAGILIGTVLFEFSRLLTFRLRWFDLPMIIWSMCPLASSISTDLGVYDGVAQSWRQTNDWFLPYLVGRLYLTDADRLREFAMGIVIGGLCLIPFTLYEVRMSPRLLPMVYGLGLWEGTRYSGYRPRVFFFTGIEFGLWMCCVTLVAWWHWQTGHLKRLLGCPGAVIVAALLLTTIACRATSAMVLNIAGFSALWFSWRTKTKWVMWCLLAVAPIYYAVRIPALWSGVQAVELAQRLLNVERARSLDYRQMGMEDLYIAKAQQRLILGWGGWSRNDVYDRDRAYMKYTVLDGRWVGALGNYGLLGLISMTTALLLPTALLIKRFPVPQWSHANLVSATGFALILNLFVIDGLINGMPNILYVIAAGGLSNIVALRGPQGVKRGIGPQARTMAEYRDLGRAMKNQGRFAEAKTAWLCALDLLTKRPAARPGRAVLELPWSNCAFQRSGSALLGNLFLIWVFEILSLPFRLL